MRALLESEGEPVAVVRELKASGARVPGFGHPVHKPLDPRAERILELADERGVSGAYVARARQFRDAVEEVYGKPLTMNVSMPIAAVMLDLGYSSADVNAVPILARTAGLLAHLAEERRHPVGLRDGEGGGGGGRVRALTSKRGRGTSSSRSTTRATASSSPTCSTDRRSTARSSAWPRRRRRAGSRTSHSCL